MKLTKLQTKKIMKKGAILCGFLVVPVMYALASPHSPGGDPGGGPGVPIDGGISLLVAAGIGYGVKKAHERKSGKKQTSEIDNPAGL